MRVRVGILLLCLLGAGVAWSVWQQRGQPASGIDLKGRNLAAALGADFDEYANGGWRKAMALPADHPIYNVFTPLRQQSEERVEKIVQDAAAAGAPAGSPERSIADFYASYMDIGSIEKQGLAPIRPRLDRIAAISTGTALSRALGTQLQADVDPLNWGHFDTPNLFGLWVGQALDDPNTNVPYLLQGGLGLLLPDYYLSNEPRMREIRARYRDYICNLLTLAGYDDAAGRANRILQLETKIARAQEPLETGRNVLNANNRWRRSDFARLAPGIDWDAYFDGAKLGRQDLFIAWQSRGIARISALVRSEPLSAWKDWLAFNELNRMSPYLDRRFADANFDFYGRRIRGADAPGERWKSAIASVNAYLGDAVGRIYMARHFPAASDVAVRKLVADLLRAFTARVQRVPWMTPATRARALEKIRTIRIGVGHSAMWRSYAGYEVRRNDLVGNVIRGTDYEYRHQLDKLGRRPDKDEWSVLPQLINAMNLPLQNKIDFPAAILEPPFFDARADPAANYGALGSVIGHEIVHSFDDTGAEFDADGRLRNWWTPSDRAAFQTLAGRLAEQYSAYQPLPGLHVNGRQTLSENIADVAGLAAAYDAYHLALGGRAAPVIDGLTGDQRFFLAFAQSHRSKAGTEALRHQILTNFHAPDSIRTLAVRNIDGWYQAFRVTASDKLYLAPRDRLPIW